MEEGIGLTGLTLSHDSVYWPTILTVFRVVFRVRVSIMLNEGGACTLRCSRW
jgi:hypothetical protein